MTNEFVVKNGLIIKPVENDNQKILYVSETGAVSASDFSVQDLEQINSSVIAISGDVESLDSRVTVLETASVSASEVIFDPSTNTLISSSSQGAIEELDARTVDLQDQVDALTSDISSQPISADSGIVIPFTNADLTGGIVSFDHALNEKHVIVEIYDNNDNVLTPDKIIAIDDDNVNVDLSSFGTISGTWYAAIHSSSFRISSDQFTELLNTFTVTTVTETSSTDSDFGTFAFEVSGADITYTIPDPTLENEGRTMRFFVAENATSNVVSLQTDTLQQIGESTSQDIIKLNTGFTLLSYDGKWNIIQDSRSTKSYIFQSPELDSPNNSDWAVNSLAPAAADSNNAGIIVRTFDDTTEEGVGFNFILPENSSFMNITFVSRAGSTQTGNVVPKIYFRSLDDNAQISSWSAGTSLNAVAMTSNENWHFDTQTLDLNTLGVPMDSNQLFIELTRDTGNGSDTLTGDWVLFQVQVEIA